MNVLSDSPKLTCHQEKLYKAYHERVASVGDITDEMVLKYIKAYRLMRQSGLNYSKYLRKGGSRSGLEGFRRIENAVRKGGFKNYAEFVRVNAKIAWAWNISQGRRGMQKQAKLQDWAQNETDKGIILIRQQLRNPDLPAETRKELKKTIAQLQKNKKTLSRKFTKNMKWAKWAMEFTKPLTNEKDIAVIIRHEKALMEVFTGLNREHS